MELVQKMAKKPYVRIVHGTGKISQRQGFMSFIQTCPYCNGTGEIVKDNRWCM